MIAERKPGKKRKSRQEQATKVTNGLRLKAIGMPRGRHDLSGRFWKNDNSEKSQRKKQQIDKKHEKKKNADLITMPHQFDNESRMTLPNKRPSTEEGNAHGDSEEEIDEGPQGRVVRYFIIQQI